MNRKTTTSLRPLNAILWREWLKMRGAAFLLIASAVMIDAYLAVYIGKIAELQGNQTIWEALITKDTVVMEDFRWFPAAAAALLVVMQTVPDMSERRFRLHLHLPVPHSLMMLSSVSLGLLALLLADGLWIGGFLLIMSSHVAAPLLVDIGLAALPWCLSGWTLYLFGYAMMIEHRPVTRIFVFFVGTAATMLFFLNGIPRSYGGVLVPLAIYSVGGGVAFALRSLLRYKIGKGSNPFGEQ